MRIVGETKFDFMGSRRIWLVVSLVLVFSAIVLIGTRGITKGVEFTGGASVTLRYAEIPDLDSVRKTLIDAGFDGVSVTTFQHISGEVSNEVLIRVAEVVDRAEIKTPMTPQEIREREKAPDATHKPDTAQLVVHTLRPVEAREKMAEGLVDLNIVDTPSMTLRLTHDAGLDEAAAEAAAEAISEYRTNHADLISDVSELASIEGLDAAARAYLEEKAFAGPFSLRGQEQFDSSISGEMRNKAIGAIVGALIGMLIYIWLRFQLQYGLAAILALIHDTLITLGAFVLVGYEANLPVVAAFLTLIGYSINDTIVIFDRIRENVRRQSNASLIQMINKSINQNLGRTVITSMTTWAVVMSLFILGGVVIRPFAFVLLVGVLVGTYSSIYVASTFLLFWSKALHKSVQASGSKAQKARAAKAAR